MLPLERIEPQRDAAHPPRRRAHPPPPAPHPQLTQPTPRRPANSLDADHLSALCAELPTHAFSRPHRRCLPRTASRGRSPKLHHLQVEREAPASPPQRPRDGRRSAAFDRGEIGERSPSLPRNAYGRPFEPSGDPAVHDVEVEVRTSELPLVPRRPSGPSGAPPGRPGFTTARPGAEVCVERDSAPPPMSTTTPRRGRWPRRCPRAARRGACRHVVHHADHAVAVLALIPPP